MRQWMVDPKVLCRNHLLGEHREHHTFVGTILKGINVTGYIEAGELDPHKLKERHDELVVEMVRRGYSHYSPLDQPDVSHIKGKPYIDVEANLHDLASRDCKCSPSCKELQDSVKET